MIVLGIDPGSVRVGYGVIKKEGGNCKYIESGLLPIPSPRTKESLLIADTSFNALLLRIKPDRIGIEKLFFTKNKKTGMTVAETRGVLLRSILARHIPFVEIAPSEMKGAITGNGNANKEAVAKMMRYMLHIPSSTPKLIDDASDALALAITAAHHESFLTK